MVTTTSVDQLSGTPHAIAFGGNEPKTVRLKLAEGESVGAHRHPDRHVVLYLVSGEIELSLDDESHLLQTGDLVRFDGDREISPSANVDSTALIVLAEKAPRE